MSILKNICDEGKTIIIGRHVNGLTGYYASIIPCEESLDDAEGYLDCLDVCCWDSCGHGDTILGALGNLSQVYNGTGTAPMTDGFLITKSTDPSNRQ